MRGVSLKESWAAPSGQVEWQDIGDQSLSFTGR
jgi:hypothetical protein